MYRIFICAMVVVLNGCSKNEQPVEEPTFTNLRVNAFTVDALQLQVTANDAFLTDSLITPAGSKTIPVSYIDPAHRIRITDVNTTRLMADTLVNYGTGFIYSLTFFQPAAGARLLLMGPPANEPAPAAGKAKIAIVYTETLQYNIPSAIKVVVENKTGLDYIATDSFLLTRGQFSKFFLGEKTIKPRLKIFTTGADRMPVAEADPGVFIQANGDFAIYNFEAISDDKKVSMIKLY
jgi:hypothetical protein